MNSNSARNVDGIEFNEQDEDGAEANSEIKKGS